MEVGFLLDSCSVRGVGGTIYLEDHPMTWIRG